MQWQLFFDTSECNTDFIDVMKYLHKKTKDVPIGHLELA